MKNINEIKEEVYKCSKCGLCKSVCPLYLATKNELYSPRGRNIVLNDFFSKGKKLSNKFIKELDICLNCDACKEFCPSSIDSSSVYSSLKKVSLYFYLKIYFLLIFYSLFNFYKKYKPEKINSQNKVIYFEGCYNRYIDASDRNSTLKLIEKNGYEVVKVVSSCCGNIFLSNSDYKSFEKNSKKIINECNIDVDYIVCSCDSCFETLSKIQNEKLNSKLITIDEFLLINKYPIDISSELYFKPLVRKSDFSFSTNLINTKSACSLMENFFLLKYPKLSKKILESNIFDEKILSNKTIITSCNLTKMGLRTFLKKDIRSFSEFIMKK